MRRVSLAMFAIGVVFLFFGVSVRTSHYFTVHCIGWLEIVRNLEIGPNFLLGFLAPDALCCVIAAALIKTAKPAGPSRARTRGPQPRDVRFAICVSAALVAVPMCAGSLASVSSTDDCRGLGMEHLEMLPFFTAVGLFALSVLVANAAAMKSSR